MLVPIGHLARAPAVPRVLAARTPLRRDLRADAAHRVVQHLVVIVDVVGAREAGQLASPPLGVRVAEIERVAQAPVGLGGPVGRVGEVVAQLGNLSKTETNVEKEKRRKR